MPDKSWMLNKTAITAAKKCISIVEAELGVRLKLSHPDFLDLLIEYVDLNDSLDLQQALLVLAQYAPVKVEPNTANVTELNLTNEPRPVSANEVSDSKVSSVVLYKGKSYLRYKDGGEFKGLYRGQPLYK